MEGRDMTDEMITTEGLSIATIQQLLNDAYFEVSLDQDGDIVVKDQYRSWVQVPPSADCVRFMSQFGAKPEAADVAKIAFANRVNQQLRVPRAYLNQHGGFTFDHYVYVEGGLPKRNLVQVLRRFMRSLQMALDLDELDVVK
jgi:hypothetical protein